MPIASLPCIRTWHSNIRPVLFANGIWRPELERYTGLVQQIKEKSKERKALVAEKKELPIYHVKRHKTLAVRIAELTEELEELRSEKAAERQLEETLQKKPSFSLLLSAKQEVSRLLGEDTEERQARQMVIRRQRSDPQKPKHFQR